MKNSANTRHTFVVVAMAIASLLAAGCASPPARDIVNYDFGIATSPQNPRIGSDLMVADVQAPAWMENTGIFYRLAYADAARPQAYANSRWIMPPAGLLTQRLRAVLRASSKAAVVSPGDGARTDLVLRVDLDEFTQVFDATERSRGVLRASARLLKGREVLATRVFSIELPAASANAEGGARALASASDSLGNQLADWIAANTRR